MNKYLPITVIMITLNEAHNIERIAENLKGRISEVIVLDSFSRDETVNICLKNNFKVYQHPFDGFGSQWNTALKIPVSNPWTMKLDPDEFISEELFNSIEEKIYNNDPNFGSFYLKRQLTFLGHPLKIYDFPLRIWKTGTCKFAATSVNEYPIVPGKSEILHGTLYHHDSPSLEHWFDKQNKYSSKEGIERVQNQTPLLTVKIFTNPEIRKRWIKKYFWKIPFKYNLLFFYLFFIKGGFKSGYHGYLWVKSRLIVYKLYELKYKEISLLKFNEYPKYSNGIGNPDSRCESI